MLKRFIYFMCVGRAAHPVRFEGKSVSCINCVYREVSSIVPFGHFFFFIFVFFFFWHLYDNLNLQRHVYGDEHLH